MSFKVFPTQTIPSFHDFKHTEDDFPAMGMMLFACLEQRGALPTLCSLFLAAAKLLQPGAALGQGHPAAVLGISMEWDGCTVPLELCPVPAAPSVGSALPWLLCTCQSQRCSLLQLLAKSQPSPPGSAFLWKSKSSVQNPRGDTAPPGTSAPKFQPCSGASAPAAAPNPRGKESPAIPGSLVPGSSRGSVPQGCTCCAQRGGGTHSPGAVKSWDALPGRRWK